MANKSYHPKWDDSQKEFADAITKLKLWNWLAQDKPPKDKGYMFWEHENIDKFQNLLKINIILVLHLHFIYVICNTGPKIITITQNN